MRMTADFAAWAVIACAAAEGFFAFPDLEDDDFLVGMLILLID